MLVTESPILGCGLPQFEMHSLWVALPRPLAALLGLALLFAASSSAAQPRRQRPASAGYASIVEAVAPSVVTVSVERDEAKVEGFLGESYGGVGRSGGSGIVVSPDGLMLTNYHVVKDAYRIEVELFDKRRVMATLIGADPATDIALLQADAKGLKAARFGNSTVVRAGDQVLAIGAPFGLRHTVTAGVISSTDRTHSQEGVVSEYLQTDAQINPGNSGGPLVNLLGEIIGINTAYMGGGTAIGFAIPSNLAREISKRLRTRGHADRGQLGMEIQPITHALAKYFRLEGTDGALISKIMPRGPASKAGLRPGDIVLEFGGKPILEAQQLLRCIGAMAKGEKRALLFLRNGRRSRVTVIAEASQQIRMKRSERAAADAPMLGIEARVLTSALRTQFRYRRPGKVIVTRVAPGSPAERAGLTPGVALLEADLHPIERPRDLFEALEDERVLLRAEDRDGHAAYLLLSAEGAL